MSNTLLIIHTWRAHRESESKTKRLNNTPTAPLSATKTHQSLLCPFICVCACKSKGTHTHTHTNARTQAQTALALCSSSQCWGGKGFCGRRGNYLPQLTLSGRRGGWLFIRSEWDNERRKEKRRRGQCWVWCTAFFSASHPLFYFHP